MVGSSAIRISWGRSSTASRGPAAIAAAAAALGAPAYPYPSVGVVPAASGTPSCPFILPRQVVLEDGSLDAGSEHRLRDLLLPKGGPISTPLICCTSGN